MQITKTAPKKSVTSKQRLVRKVADLKQVQAFKRHEESIAAEQASKRPKEGYSWDTRSPGKYAMDKQAEIDSAAKNMEKDLEGDWEDRDKGITDGYIKRTLKRINSSVSRSVDGTVRGSAKKRP